MVGINPLWRRASSQGCQVDMSKKIKIHFKFRNDDETVHRSQVI
jgi:hypothetical protein